MTIKVFGLNDTEILPCAPYILQNITTNMLIHNLLPNKGSLNEFSFNQLTENDGNLITYDGVMMLNAYLTSSNYARDYIGNKTD